MTELRLPSEDGGVPRLETRPSEWATVCRCGTWILRGEPRVEVVGLPPSLEVTFHGQGFCSPQCVRAFFLEVLIVLETRETPDAEAQAADLRKLHAYLASAFARLLDVAPYPVGAGPRELDGPRLG